MEHAEHAIWDEDTNPDVTGRCEAIMAPSIRAAARVNENLDSLEQQLDAFRIEFSKRVVLVLLVEDDANTIAALGATMARAGIDFEGAGDAATAKRKVLNRLAEGSAFDAAIVDVHLPGASGVQLALELRRIAPNMPVILISGEEIDAKLIASCGACAFISKPFEPAELLAELSRQLPEKEETT